MADSGEPAVKKAKVDEIDPVFKLFLEHNKSDVKNLQIGLVALNYGLSNCQIRSVKIVAANARFPLPFTSANIFFEQTGDFESIGAVFKKAYRILNDYINSDLEKGDPQIPCDSDCRRALAKLLHYVQNLDKESRALSWDSSRGSDEWCWMLKLAQHVFSKLSLNSNYLYDVQKDYDTSGGCPCADHDELLGEKGDTSFGWERGWHGKIDILMGDVPVCKIGEFEKDDDWNSPSPVSSCSSVVETDSSIGIEVKKSPEFSVYDYFQIIAETITFSFLQNKKKYAVTLVPSIAVNKDSIQVHFYDSEKDVLIQSGILPLIILEPDQTTSLNTVAVLVIWMTLNHRLFCTGSIEGMEKSGFHQQIDVDAFRKGVKAPCNVKKNTDQKWIGDKVWAAKPRPITIQK